LCARILAAMDPRPVLTTIPAETSGERAGSSEARLREAFEFVLGLVGQRAFRIEYEIAAFLHGDRTAQTDMMVVRMHGDPDKLDRLCVVIGRVREVMAVRSPDNLPHIRFEAAGVEVGLYSRPEPAPSIPIAYEGLVLSVAPADEIARPRDYPDAEP
jgi:hypothetical protein